MKNIKPLLNNLLFIVIVIEGILLIIFYVADPYHYEKPFPYLLLILSLLFMIIFNYFKKSWLIYPTAIIIFLIMIILYFM